MALQVYPLAFPQIFFAVSRPKQNLTQVIKQKCRQHHPIRCIDNNNVMEADNSFAIYQPTTWSDDFIKSLDTNFPIKYMEKVKELEKKVIELINIDYEHASLGNLQLLELIDNIERLGLGYRFQSNVRIALNKIALINEYNNGSEEKEDDLYTMSLQFRLLRQHGYNVSQDFLTRFKDNNGGFMGCLGKDVKGLLSLYEASYLAFEGEKDFHEAKLFSIEHLLKLKDQENEAVNYALELPLYRRMLRLQARWYIDAYSKQKDVNLLLLELAILDFNMVQSALKRELQEVTKWWEKIGLTSKLSFIRNRHVECFFGTVGIAFEPQYHFCRVELTKVCTLIASIDDIYDVYGSLDELKVFTDAAKRWDINSVTHMPEYLQLGFISLYNTVNAMGYNTLILQGENIIPILRGVWGELFGAFFVEAEWTHNKFMPTLEDYLENAWRSVSGVVILTHAYFLINRDIKRYPVESLKKCHDLLKWSSMICLLCNDLGISADEIKRGKTANAISCYMHENGVCEKIAREYIKTLNDEAWMKLIEPRVACSKDISDSFIDMSINFARASHCAYQYGDGIGAPNAGAKEQVLSVIIKPITINKQER